MSTAAHESDEAVLESFGLQAGAAPVALVLDELRDRLRVHLTGRRPVRDHRARHVRRRAGVSVALFIVLDPVTPAVVDAFGSWAEKPFELVVLAAFVACGIAVQGDRDARDVLAQPRRDASGLAVPQARGREQGAARRGHHAARSPCLPGGPPGLDTPESR
ncbi:MAG TPA: hypothetical protein VFM58_05795 [Solirubrobacteraceae bacterium]|nr:hypothetical protein [Solirubrobacteraceae bacterium]